ncbi:MAG: hypothetical protein JWR46_2223, partial [Mycobacterium sp.]|nr:hypothetical protein [Mycobacterium sp.]
LRRGRDGLVRFLDALVDHHGPEKTETTDDC